MTPAARVLIVDDRDIVRETLRDILDDFDCSFAEADNGESALVLLHEREFDVIFLDLKLPDLPGIEVLRELGRSGVVQGKLIILTGQPDPMTKVEAENLGVFRYLTKPLDWAAIREAFTAALAHYDPLFETSKPEHKIEPKIVTPAGRRRSRPRASAVRQPVRDRRPRLLILDDDPSWLETLEQVLGSDFHLVLTTSAEEAYKLAMREYFDLVILDKQLLAGLSGLDVLSRMRSATPNIRAIILTGFPDLRSAMESGRRGALDYVSKADLTNLSDTIRRVLSEPQLSLEALQTVRVFLETACYSVTQTGPNSFSVTTRVKRLTPYEPLPVYATEGPTTSSDVDLIVEASPKHSREGAGFLVYQQLPDTLARIRIAQRRLEDRFWLIPIPFQEVARAVREEASTALLAEYADRYLPGADLFADRNAIGDTLSFFGRSELLKLLKDELLQLQSVGLFGIRKSGKTSILLQLPHVLLGHPVVHLDLQPFGGTGPFAINLLNRILGSLAAYAPSSSFPRIHPDLSISEVGSRFIDIFLAVVQVLQTIGRRMPVLCFIDEIERIIPRQNDDLARINDFNGFFGTLRALSQQYRNLSLLVADTHPDCNRTNRWRSESATNPVFSFFKEVYMRPFNADETESMIHDIGALMSRHFDTDTLGSLHFLSGGHPFISRQLASLLCSKVPHSGDGCITYSQASQYLKRALQLSPFLKTYLATSIWDDHRYRGNEAHMGILRLLACQQGDQLEISKADLFAKLASLYNPDATTGALLELEQLGLIQQVSDQSTGDSVRAAMGLLMEWIRAGMNEEEVERWQG